MSGQFFTDFKSLNGIEISWLVQALLNFYWFRGPPLGGYGWVDEGEGGHRCVGECSMHRCMHTYAHTRTHTCTCMLNMINMDASTVGSHLQFLYIYTCACVHVCSYTCMWGYPFMHPDTPRHPPTHLPPLQSHRESKTAKFNKSWTNRDNSILFEDSLPLNIPELI